MSLKEVAATTKRGETLLRILDTLDLLAIPNLKIHGDGVDKIQVHDPAQPAREELREGDFFVTLPKNIAEVLPGSSLGSKAFLKEIQGNHDEDTTSRLLGNFEGKEGNLALSKHNEGFQLNVFHGSTNGRALEISRLAFKGTELTAKLKDLEDRGQSQSIDFVSKNNEYQRTRGDYQKQVAEIMEPILKHKQDDLNNPNVFRIIEDCLASGDTIVGVLSLLSEKSRVDFGDKKIRIDVAVATTQGVLVLKKFAKDNNLNLELNVGYLAYGLSQGEKKDGVKMHANYITYPPEIVDRLTPEMGEKLKRYCYVVGDMGDLFRSMENSFDDQYSLNRLRTDSHGDREQVEESVVSRQIDLLKPMVLFFANGGYFMRALWKSIYPDSNINEIIFSAKRTWSDDPAYGYGVLIYDLPEEILH